MSRASTSDCFSYCSSGTSWWLELRGFFDWLLSISLRDSLGSSVYLLIALASTHAKRPSTSSIFMRSGSFTVSHPPMGSPFDSRLKFQTTLIPQLQSSACCGVGYSCECQSVDNGDLQGLCHSLLRYTYISTLQTLPIVALGMFLSSSLGKSSPVPTGKPSSILNCRQSWLD